MGAAARARAISHLEHVSEAGIAAMAAGRVFAVLLPTTAYVLRHVRVHSLACVRFVCSLAGWRGRALC